MFCMKNASVLEESIELSYYLCPERKISFDGFVHYEGRRFGVPYWYTEKTPCKKRWLHTLHIRLKNDKSAHITCVTWSRCDSFCKDQYVTEQPEERPTAPVKIHIQQLNPPPYDSGFSKFNFEGDCGMNNSLFEQIQDAAEYLNLDLNAQEMAQLAVGHEYSEENIRIVAEMFTYLQQKKKENIVSTLLRLSRLPLKEPKTFESFDFGQLHGKQTDALRNLPSLSALYAHKNLAFIGPQGVGKTHLAMAYGRKCCQNGLKAYFLKATELNQRLADARKYGRESSTINGLVKPSCLIIDEIGRCVFDKENTRMFFDVIDRRYNKEGPNTMIFTSNKGPDKWGEFFNEDSSLLCALDRIFDDATVFMIKGNSYRGKNCETIALSAGAPSALPKAQH